MAKGTLRLGQAPLEPHPGFDDAGEASARLAGKLRLGSGRALFACLPGVAASAPPQAHFNGKLERPTMWEGGDVAAARAAQRRTVPKGPTPGLIACWDFSIGIPTLGLADIGPSGFHGTVENLPSRAMTGSNWSGSEHRWTHRPEEWGAIHFHDDDLGDVGWETSFELEIPPDWPSGLYAIHLKSEAGVDNIPFIVRPADGAPRAKIAVLMPTVSYHVYSQFVRPGFGERNRARAKEWGAIIHTPDENPELGLSPYNFHSELLALRRQLHHRLAEPRRPRA